MKQVLDMKLTKGIVVSSVGTQAFLMVQELNWYIIRKFF